MDEIICNICGEQREATKEHVPPKSAFNNRMVVRTTADEYWNRGQSQGMKIRGKKYHGGFGVYTICERCNTPPGGWYGAEFIEWCKQGMEYLEKTKGRARWIK